MKQNVKGHDRYGGEEFVIALPNATLRLAITVDRFICETDQEAEPRTNPETRPPAQVA
jgi:GGDEF domain-containing protein